MSKRVLPAASIALALVLTGCTGDTSRNRQDDTEKAADHVGAMGGTGGTKASGDLGTGTGDMGTKGNTDSDQRNRTGTETGMSSGTTGGGISSSGTERGNHPHRRDR